MPPCFSRRACVGVILAILTGACFGSANRNPPRNAELLAPGLIIGRWEGTYWARTIDRDGRFRLFVESQGDSLAGWLDLVGIEVGEGRAVSAGAGARGDSVRVAIPTITIDGVRARFRSASYWDPGCGCSLRLDITGFVVADTLGGYFDTFGTPLMATERGGRWRAVRVR